MNYKLNAIKTISKRRIFETVISPGFYVATAAGLFSGYYLLSGFLDSVDSGGLNFSLHPVYNQIVEILSGAFGITFVEKLFSEGPFVFVLFVSFIPVFLYHAINTVFKFGFEKNVGALELLMYGPSDGTCFFLSFFIKDVLFTVIYIFTLALFFYLSSVINNLVLGPMFYFSLLIIFFLAVSGYSYGILASVLSGNAATSVALFSGIVVFFVILQIGSFAITRDYVKNLTNVIMWFIKWISPFFYMDIGLSAALYGNFFLFLLSILSILIISAVLLLISHFVLKVKGVRP